MADHTGIGWTDLLCTNWLPRNPFREEFAITVRNRHQGGEGL